MPIKFPTFYISYIFLCTQPQLAMVVQICLELIYLLLLWYSRSCVLVWWASGRRVCTKANAWPWEFFPSVKKHWKVDVLARLGSMATMSLLLVWRGVSLPQVIPSTNELQVWSKCRSAVHGLEHVVFDCPVIFMRKARFSQSSSTWTSMSHCWVIAG